MFVSAPQDVLFVGYVALELRDNASAPTRTLRIVADDNLSITWSLTRQAVRSSSPQEISPPVGDLLKRERAASVAQVEHVLVLATKQLLFCSGIAERAISAAYESLDHLQLHLYNRRGYKFYTASDCKTILLVSGEGERCSPCARVYKNMKDWVNKKRRKQERERERERDTESVGGEGDGEGEGEGEGDGEGNGERGEKERDARGGREGSGRDVDTLMIFFRSLRITVANAHDELCGDVCGAALALGGTRALSRRARELCGIGGDCAQGGGSDNAGLLTLLCVLHNALGRNGDLFHTVPAAVVDDTVVSLSVELFDRLGQRAYEAVRSRLPTLCLPGTTTLRRRSDLRTRAESHIGEWVSAASEYVASIALGRVNMDVVDVLHRMVVIFRDASAASQGLHRLNTALGSVTGAARTAATADLVRSEASAGGTRSGSQVLAVSAVLPFFYGCRGMAFVCQVDRYSQDKAADAEFCDDIVAQLAAHGQRVIAVGGDADKAQVAVAQARRLHFGSVSGAAARHTTARGASAGSAAVAHSSDTRVQSDTVVGGDQQVGSSDELNTDEFCIGAASFAALGTQDFASVDLDGVGQQDSVAVDESVASDGDGDDDDDSFVSPDALLPPPTGDDLRAWFTVDERPYLTVSDATHLWKRLYKHFRLCAFALPPPDCVVDFHAWSAVNSRRLRLSVEVFEVALLVADDDTVGPHAVPWITATMRAAAVLPTGSYDAMAVRPMVSLFGFQWRAALEHFLGSTFDQFSAMRDLLDVASPIIDFWHNSTLQLTAAAWRTPERGQRAMFVRARVLFAHWQAVWATTAHKLGALRDAGIRSPPALLLIDLVEHCDSSLELFDTLFGVVDVANVDFPPSDGEELFVARLNPMSMTQNRLEQFFSVARGGRGGTSVSRASMDGTASRTNRLMKQGPAGVSRSTRRVKQEHRRNVTRTTNETLSRAKRARSDDK